MSHFQTIMDFVRHCVELCGMQAFDVKIQVATEEIIVNVIKYGYAQEEEGSVIVESWADDSSAKNIVFRISDKGIAFDPTDTATPDCTAALRDRPIGGLGVFLTTQIMDTVVYTRENDRNVLQMQLTVPDEN